jgi:hypothetical protein
MSEIILAILIAHVTQTNQALAKVCDELFIERKCS